MYIHENNVIYLKNQTSYFDENNVYKVALSRCDHSKI